MGLFLDRPAFKIDPKGFSACNNVRIERGRVRADLLGWTGPIFNQLPSDCLYISRFVNSDGAERLFAITPTDIIQLQGNGANTYITPVYASGSVSATNGSATISGTGTRFAADIQYGDAYTAAATASSGNVVKVHGPFISDFLLPVTDQSSAGAILAGTILNTLAANSDGTFSLGLSQALNSTVTSGDTIVVGSGVKLRPNVRPGDQISFGNYRDSSLISTWYTVQTVNSDTSLTLSANYTGTSFTNGAYRVRQLLTNTISGPSPSLPPSNSANFPAAGGATLGNAYGSVNVNGDDLWIYTNGTDPVIVKPWACYSSYFSRSIPFKANSLVQTRGLLVCGGLTEGNGTQLNSSIASSDNGFPQKMAGGVAFQGIASDGPFTVSRLGILGSTLMIYLTGSWGGAANQQDDASGSVTSAAFVGFPTIWAFSDVIRTRGPVCGGAVVEFPDRHQFLSIDGEYRYNGLFIQVMNDQVWREVMQNFDTTRPNACFALVVPTFGDLIWAVPLLTDPAGQLYASTAYVEHYMEQANNYLFKPFTVRDFPFTCGAAFFNFAPATFASLTQTFGEISRSWASFGVGGNQPQYVAGDVQGNIWALYSSNTQNGTPALCTATWASRVVGNGRARPLITRVYPEVDYIAEPASPLIVTLTLQDAPTGPVTITDTQTFDPSYAGNRFTVHYRRGRVGAVTFSDRDGLGWTAAGYDWDWTNGGLR